MNKKAPKQLDTKKTVIKGVAIAGGVLLGLHFGRKAYQNWKQRSTTANLDQSPAVRQAMGLRSAMNTSGTSWLMWSDGTNEKAIQQIATQITDLNQVALAYRNLYRDELVADLQSELNTKDFNAFMQTVSNNRINHSGGNSTSSSTSGNYTAAQNLVVAKQAVYVRTSPDASYHGAWYEINGNKNIYKTAKAGEFVGYATGKQHYDSDNNVKFIEVAYRVASSGETRILWISASSNYTEQFSSVAAMEAKYPLTKGITQTFLPIQGLGSLTQSGQRAIARCNTPMMDKRFRPTHRARKNMVLGAPVMNLQGNDSNYTMVKTVQGLDRWVKTDNIITQ